MTEGEIKKFFDDQVGNVAKVEVFQKDGKFRGAAIVSFTSETEAKYALGTVYILGQ